MNEETKVPQTSRNFDPVRYFGAINGDEEDIPPYGIVRVNAIDSEGRLIVGAPTIAGQTDVYFNGHCPIAPGFAGEISDTMPAFVAFSQSGDLPSNGEIWGTLPGSYLLQRSAPGFVVVGDGIDGVCLIARMSHQYLSLIEIVSSNRDASGYQDAYEVQPIVLEDSFQRSERIWANDTNGRLLRVGVYLAFLGGNRSGRRLFYGFIYVGGTASSSSALGIASLFQSQQIVTDAYCDPVGGLVVVKKCITGQFTISDAC